MEPKHTWSELLQAYLKGSISAVEKEELVRQMATSADKQREFDACTNFKIALHHVQQEISIDTQFEWNRFKALINSPKKKQVVPFYIIRKFTSASFNKVKKFIATSFHKNKKLIPAAASILLIFALFLFREPSNTGERGYSNLELAGGKLIDLRTAADGLLAENSNGSVYKEGNLIRMTSNNHRSGNQPNLNNALYNAGGEFHQIELPDGSLAKLNARSSIKFPTSFGADRRTVQITGEVYFIVKANTASPFIIQTPKGVSLSVTGTSFNVRGYENDDYIITLLSGALEVGDSKEKIILKQPGEQAIWTKEGGRKEINPALNQVIAWTRDTFDFTKQPITSIFQDLGRWYNKKVIIEGTLPNATSSGRFYRKEDLKSILATLDNYNPTMSTISGDSIIVKYVEK